MKLSWNWLLSLCDLPRAPTPAEGAAALTRLGIEVEALEATGAAFSGVVVAEVVAVRPHPDAEKLRLVDVRDVRSGTATQVVCGAPNVPAPGRRVLWARPGATLPGGITLATKPVKGINSPGMLCSHVELGTGDDEGGIVVLPDGDTTALGDTAQVALGLDDWMVEIGVPANRPDLLGHIGVAHELCSALGGRVVMPDCALIAVTRGDDFAREFVVGPLSPDCARFVARQIDGVTVGPAPLKIASRLRTVGVRAISNIVDATNYVMMEFGQPLHAFDARKLPTRALSVRAARAGETLVTLDDQRRTLEPGDLLVCSGEVPVALAGVMGGANSEVDVTTQSIVLESARFLPQQVRRTVRRLGLLSEASTRFERGVDAARCDLASARAAKLIAQWSGGHVRPGAVDPIGAPPPRTAIAVRPRRVEKLLGLALSESEIADSLRAQTFVVAEAGAKSERTFDVTPPSWRSDVTREVDVIEEVVRMVGLERVGTTLPPLRAAPKQRVTLADDVRAALVHAGLLEAITFGFTSMSRLAALGLPADDIRTQPYQLANPMSVEQGVMRTTLVPNLLAAVARNVAHRRLNMALFEVGHVFLPAATLADEPLWAAGVVSGHAPRHISSVRAYDVFDVVGIVQACLSELGWQPTFLNGAPMPYLHPGAAATVHVAGVRVGWVGEVHPRTAKNFDIPRTFLFELNLAALPARTVKLMAPIAKFPAATRDVSLLVDETISVGRIAALMHGQALLESAELVDDYRGASLPAGKKSLSWSISYRAPDRTLADAEIDQAHEQLVAHLCRTLSAERR